MAAPSSPFKVSFNDLHAFVLASLQSTGMSREDADKVARTLVSTDAMGVLTHGTKLLAGYIKKLQKKGYDPKGVPTIEREGPAWAVIDGVSALGMIGCHLATQLAVFKAQQVGIAYVGLKNTGHVGEIGRAHV